MMNMSLENSFKSYLLNRSFYSARLINIVNKMCAKNPKKRMNMKENIF